MVYYNPMGIGFGAGPLDKALQLYNKHVGNNLQRDFHGDFVNIAVMFGVPGVLLFLARFLCCFAP